MCTVGSTRVTGPSAADPPTADNNKQTLFLHINHCVDPPKSSARYKQTDNAANIYTTFTMPSACDK